MSKSKALNFVIFADTVEIGLESVALPTKSGFEDCQRSAAGVEDVASSNS